MVGKAKNEERGRKRREGEKEGREKWSWEKAGRGQEDRRGERTEGGRHLKQPSVPLASKA